MKLEDVPVEVQYVGVALLFAISVAGLGVGFALLSALLYLRSWRIVIAAPLMIAVYFIAALIVVFGRAFVLDMPLLFVGGCIGGFGMVMCTGICQPWAISAKHTVVATLLGGVAALSFGLNVGPTFDWVLLIFAAIWHVTVGTYLFAIVRNTSNETHGGDAAGPIILRLR